MPTIPLQPPVADSAPASHTVTRYDRQHFVTYWRLLDAEAEGADWRDVAKIVLHLDPMLDEDRARQSWRSHLARAHWLADNGYRHLLHGTPEI
jgi:hypothetical protein